MLDLADFDYKLIHVPGSTLNAPDALSQRPYLIPKVDDDNEGVTLLPPSLFINLIDIELNKKIAKSSKNDPIVLSALQALEGEVPDLDYLIGPMMQEFSPTKDEYTFPITPIFAMTL